MTATQSSRANDRVRQFQRLAAAAPRLKRPPRPPRAHRAAWRRPDARSHGLVPLPHPIWGCTLN